MPSDEDHPEAPLVAASGVDNDGIMSIIRINAIDVAEGKGPELARRFAGRAHAVDAAEGFEGFELLRPTDGRPTWLVVTRWRDAKAFEAWASSPAFAHGHRGAEADSESSAAPTEKPEPVTVSSQLWSYEPVDLEAP